MLKAKVAAEFDGKDANLEIEGNLPGQLQLALNAVGSSVSFSNICSYVSEVQSFSDLESVLSDSRFERESGCKAHACSINIFTMESLADFVASSALLELKTGEYCPVFIARRNGEICIEPLEGHTLSFEGLVEADALFNILFIIPVAVGRFDDTVGKANASRYAWFWRHVKPYSKVFLNVMVASAVISFLAVLGSLFTMNVYDRVVPNHAFGTLWVLATGVLVAYAFDFVLKVIRSVATDWAGKQIDLSVSSFLFDHLINIRISEKPASTGVMANHMRDFDSVRDFFTSLSLLLLVDIPFLGLYLTVIFYIGGLIVLVPVLAIPIVLIFLWAIQRPLRLAIEKSSSSSAQKHGLLIESLNGLLDLKLLNATTLIGRIWDGCAKESSDYSNKARFWSSLGVTFSGFVQQVVQVLIVIGGVYLIADGELTMGGLIACSILNGRVMAPLGQLVSLAVRMQQTWQSLNTLTNVVEKDVDRTQGKKYIMPSSLEGDVRLSGVNFKYSDEGQLVLRDINLDIKKGEKVAFVGHSGGGKSTLIKILCGLYPPKDGGVYIDNRDIRQIDPVSMRKNMIVVPQQPFLMSGTVRENLSLGSPEATDEQILEVSKISTLDDFVSRDPQGYDMQIGEGGALLSGGQKQSLAIARSLLGGGDIVVLDEPTSAMDSRTENIFKQRFASWAQDKTVILVTHKLTMLDIVDRVIVVNQGQIVSDGKKEQVIKAPQVA